MKPSFLYKLYNNNLLILKISCKDWGKGHQHRVFMSNPIMVMGKVCKLLSAVKIVEGGKHREHFEYIMSMQQRQMS